ncbi:MAG TPA: CHASE3 domain-containing protein, partial [Candidatus Acidoferrum sp.]|nr:CHASE3 domain-containing protein [Candidatus Acidoferrum sp.]
MSGVYPNGQSNGLLSLERKVLVGFGMASILLVVIGSLSYVSVMRFRSSAAEVDHTNQVLNSLSGLITDLAVAESSQRGFLIAANEEQQKEYDAAAERIVSELKHIRELTTDNSVQQKNMDDLAPHVANRLELMRRRMELRRSDGFEASIASLVPDGGRSDRDAIRQLVGKMRDEEERLLKLREATTERRSSITGTAILTGC